MTIADYTEIKIFFMRTSKIEDQAEFSDIVVRVKEI